MDILDNPFLLLALSIIPGLAYVSIYYNMDKHKKEPLGVLLRAFFWGAFLVIPIGVMQSFVPEEIFTANFITYGKYMIVVVGFTEEFGKWIVTRYYSFRNSAFDEVTDGIVYGATAAGGFAVFENIFYVLDHGFETGILRSVLSVPGHLFWGAISGYWLAMYKFGGKSKAEMLWKGLGTATISHGLFNTCLNFDFSILLTPVIVIWNGYLVRGYFKKALHHDEEFIHGMGHHYESNELVERKPDGTISYVKQETEEFQPNPGLRKILALGANLIGAVLILTGLMGLFGMWLSFSEGNFTDDDFYATILLTVWLITGIFLIYKGRVFKNSSYQKSVTKQKTIDLSHPEHFIPHSTNSPGDEKQKGHI